MEAFRVKGFPEVTEYYELHFLCPHPVTPGFMFET